MDLSKKPSQRLKEILESLESAKIIERDNQHQKHEKEKAGFHSQFTHLGANGLP